MSFGLPCWACREQVGKSKKTLCRAAGVTCRFAIVAARVCAISFGLPCWACKEQVCKSRMQNWVWLGLAKFARCMPRARFCPGVRANSFSETMLPGLNWWAYIIMTA